MHRTKKLLLEYMRVIRSSNYECFVNLFRKKIASCVTRFLFPMAKKVYEIVQLCVKSTTDDVLYDFVHQVKIKCQHFSSKYENVFPLLLHFYNFLCNVFVTLFSYRLFVARREPRQVFDHINQYLAKFKI